MSTPVDDPRDHPNYGDEHPEPPFYGCEVKCFEQHYHTTPCETCRNVENCDDVYHSIMGYEKEPQT